MNEVDEAVAFTLQMYNILNIIWVYTCFSIDCSAFVCFHFCDFRTLKLDANVVMSILIFFFSWIQPYITRHRHWHKVWSIKKKQVFQFFILWNSLDLIISHLTFFCFTKTFDLFVMRCTQLVNELFLFSWKTKIQHKRWNTIAKEWNSESTNKIYIIHCT